MKNKKIFVISINPKIHDCFKELCKSKHITISKDLEKYMISEIAKNDKNILLTNNN